MEKISYSQVESYCNELHAIAVKIKSKLEEIEGIKTSLTSGVWEGKASEAYKSELGEQIAQFDSMYMEVENSILFMAACSHGYQKLDKALLLELCGNLGISPFEPNFSTSNIFSMPNQNNNGTWGYYEVKNGTIKIKFHGNYLNNIKMRKYTGEYVEFYNSAGLKMRAPLAAVTFDDDNKVYYQELSDYQKEEYIKFLNEVHNDYLNIHDTYTEKFKEGIKDRIDTYTFMLCDSNIDIAVPEMKNIAGYASSKVWSAKSDVVINTSWSFVYNKNRASDHVTINYSGFQKQLLLETMTHEEGHAFANNTLHDLTHGDIDNNRTWNDIYEQVSNDPANKAYIGSYAMTNNNELFAEATKYYHHDPEVLKMVDIDVKNLPSNFKDASGDNTLLLQQIIHYYLS